MTRRLTRILVPLVLAALVSGCQTVASTYDRVFGAQPKRKPAELPVLQARITPKVLWQGSVGSAEKSTFSPAAAGRVVYAVGASGQLAGFDAVTGQQAMRVDVGQRVSGGVGASASLVLVGTSKGEVLAFDASGKPLWKAQLSGEVLAAPQVADGVVVVRAGYGRIYGLGATDGKRRWLHQRTTPPLSVRSPAGVTLQRGMAFAGFPGGRLAAINLVNGSVTWEGVVAVPRGTTELERVSDVASLPLVDEQRACAVAYQGRIACFDTSSGSVMWARELSSLKGMSTDGRNFYVTDDNNAIVALDKVNGASLWKQDRLAGRGVSGSLAFGRFVVVGDFEGYVHFLQRDDGSFAGRIATDGSPILSAPVALDLSSFVVQTRNGGVFAITVQ
jgi:outer membrane protein assembly factor BamB